MHTVQQRCEKAIALFGTDDFDRLFSVSTLDPQVQMAVTRPLTDRWHIHRRAISELADDLLPWRRSQARPGDRRRSLVSDLTHVLIGFCHPVVAPVDTNAHSR
jgi:hypothetical protein